MHITERIIIHGELKVWIQLVKLSAALRPRYYIIIHFWFDLSNPIYVNSLKSNELYDIFTHRAIYNNFLK